MLDTGEPLYALVPVACPAARSTQIHSAARAHVSLVAARRRPPADGRVPRIRESWSLVPLPTRVSPPRYPPGLTGERPALQFALHAQSAAS